MNVCRATKANGEPCTLPASGQHGLCWAHDPANREKRRRTASKGGKAKANREIVAAKEDVKGIIAGVLSGDIDRNAGSVAFQGYRVLLQAITTEMAVKEQQELLERIERLETAIGPRKGGRSWGT
jgi:hypothetical protein